MKEISLKTEIFEDPLFYSSLIYAFQIVAWIFAVLG